MKLYIGLIDLCESYGTDLHCAGIFDSAEKRDLAVKKLLRAYGKDSESQDDSEDKIEIDGKEYQVFENDDEEQSYEFDVFELNKECDITLTWYEE